MASTHENSKVPEASLQEEEEDNSPSSTPRRNSVSSESSSGSSNSDNTTTSIATNNTNSQHKGQSDRNDSIRPVVESLQQSTDSGETLRPADQISTSTASYAIKWNNYLAVIHNVFRRLLISHQFSDIVLACEGGESIKCHRILLAACSSYFEKILTDYQDSSNLVIFMKDIQIWQLRALVNFMYSGEVSVREDQLESFMSAAKSFNINGLDLPSNNNTSSTVDAVTNSKNSGAAADHSSSHINSKSSNSNNSSKKEVITVFPSTRTRIKQPERVKPILVPQVGTPAPNLALKRKFITTDGPPKLKKMVKTGSRPNGTNNQAPKLQDTYLKKVSRQVLEFERAQLAQQLESEDFGDIENEMERIPESAGEEVEGDQDQFNRGLQYDDPPHLENGKVEYENEVDNEELPYDDEDDNRQYDLQESINNGVGDVNQSFQLGEESGSEMDGGDDSGMQFGPGMVISAVPPPRSRNARTYDPDLQQAAFDALRRGISIRQCSELFGIPRKTLAKWKNKGLHLQGVQTSRTTYDGMKVPNKRGPPIGSSLSGPDGFDRAQRLQKATKLALSGVTVRQAAAQYDIPRTTLCAYMKRQGVGPKRTPVTAAVTRPVATTVTSTAGYSGTRRIGNTVITLSGTNDYDDDGNDEEEMDDGIPFLGLSDFIEQIGK